MENLKCNPDMNVQKFTDGDCVIFDEKTNTTHVLNRTAYMVFELFDLGASFHDALKNFQDMFEDGNEKGIEVDFTAIVADMQEKNLLLIG